MSSTDRWSIFLRFRKYIFALASILCLVWTIIISVYLARSWSGSDVALRGLLIAMIVLDVISAILLYLMIVVQYNYWPDVTRTLFLVASHAATSVLFSVFSSPSSFHCDGFGSQSNCHLMNDVVLAGSWVISGLLTAVALPLPFMAFIPLPPKPNPEDDAENPEEPTNHSDKPVKEFRKSHMATASRAQLLKYQEGFSLDAAELPAHPGLPSAVLLPSPRLSTSSIDAEEQPMQVTTPSTGSIYSSESPMERNSSILSALQYALPSPSLVTPPRHIPDSGDPSSTSRGSAQSLSTVGTSLSAFDDYTRMSGVTVPLPLPGSSPRMTPKPVIDSLSGQRARLFDESGQVFSNGSLVSAPRQATPLAHSDSMPSLSASMHQWLELDEITDEVPPPFKSIRTESPVQDDGFEEGVAIPRPNRAELTRFRMDSSGFIVDMDGWKKLVLGAAGKEL